MRVSVIVPNYNYGDYIGGAIESLLEQSEAIDEIIVVDDGSTDQSRDVIQQFGNRIISIFQDNAGQAAAISAGFLKATGDIVCLLDSDDFFDVDKVKFVKQIYNYYPQIDWVFHDLLQVEGKIRPQSGPVLFNKDCITLINEQKKIQEGKVGYDAPATSGMTFRRTFISDIFPLPAADSIYISDHYIKFYCLARGLGVHVSQALAGQLIHGENLYTGRKKMRTRGKIFVNTALALKQKCPEISTFCNSLLAEGRACLNIAGITPESEQIIREYNAELSPLELLLIESKTFIKTRRYKKAS